MRADARHNYEQLLRAADAAFGEHGPDVCLDEIARQAGVGIGTLYRHFPTRQALLEAVFLDRIEKLGAEAQDLLSAPSPGDALTAWLHSVLVYNITQRGLKEALMRDGGTELASSCKLQMRAAGAEVLARAQQAGVMRSDFDIADLLHLMYGIALATEKAPDGLEQASRLLALMLAGLRRSEPTTP
jgi:AcrR family transcriptional regulator